MATRETDDKATTAIPRMLRAPEVEALVGLSPITIWRLEKTRAFPRRRRLTSSSIGWREDEVLAWVMSREVVQSDDT